MVAIGAVAPVAAQDSPEDIKTLRVGIALMTRFMQGEKGTAQNLASMVTTVKPSIAVQLLQGMARTGDTGFMTAVVAAVGAGDPVLRKESILAMTALSKDGCAFAPEVREAYREQDKGVLIAAESFAAAVHDDEAIPALIPLLTNPDADIQQGAHSALASLFCEDLGGKPEPWSDRLQSRQAELEAMTTDLAATMQANDRSALLQKERAFNVVNDLEAYGVDALAGLVHNPNPEIAATAIGCIQSFRCAARWEFEAGRRMVRSLESGIPAKSSSVRVAATPVVVPKPSGSGFKLVIILLAIIAGVIAVLKWPSPAPRTPPKSQRPPAVDAKSDQKPRAKVTFLR